MQALSLLAQNSTHLVTTLCLHLTRWSCLCLVSVLCAPVCVCVCAIQPKLSGLDTVHLTCLLSSWSILKYEPEPLVMRRVMGEVYTKLPLFDDKVGGR